MWPRDVAAAVKRRVKRPALVATAADRVGEFRIGGWLPGEKIYMNSGSTVPLPAARPWPGLPNERYLLPIRSRPEARSVRRRRRRACCTTVIGLWPYIWPSDRRDLKMRVWSRWCCCCSPSSRPSRCRSPSNGRPMRWPGRAARRSRPTSWLAWAIAAPILMTIAYGGTRILMAVLTQVRDGIFAKVAMNAVRRLAYHGLRAHAPAVAALPSRAQDRRPHPRARARPQRHRDHRAHGDHAARADRRSSLPSSSSCCSISSTGATWWSSW